MNRYNQVQIDEEEVLLINTTDEKLLKAKMRNLRIGENDVMEEIQRKSKMRFEYKMNNQENEK